MSEIKAYYEEFRPARSGVFFAKDIPAGWTLCWVETGKSAEGEATRYATKEEAEARIPAVLAARAERIARAEAKEAERLAASRAKEAARLTAEAEAATRATERQVSYLTRLIVSAMRSGADDIALIARDYLNAEGNVDIAALRALDRRDASSLIDALTYRS